MTVYKHLFSPVTIGTMPAKNRLLMSAMSINFGVDKDGYVTEQLSAYFEARAKGGVGLMLVGGGAVHPTGLELPDLPTLWDDGCIDPLKKIVASVKPYDVRFGVQLMHGGRQSYLDQRVAPSPIEALAVVKGIPEELTLENIKELVASFGDAARRCREAGFDFVEIHGAHGYLINQFLAPNSNQRSDAYGGSFENRCRFFLEVFEDIKAKTGVDFPVGVRMNGRDYIENGFDLGEAIQLAGLLEEKGADYLHVSAGIYGSSELTIPSAYTDQGCFIYLAEAVKKTVNIPVIAVGRIKTADMAEAVLRDGKADLVAMGRALLADPELPNKAKDDRLDQIRPCIGCCLGCIHAVLSKEPGGCVVNPEVGREYLLKNPFSPESPKKVLIIGGGPAGMATARMTARAGHRVTLCESSGHLGGLLRIAAKAPKRWEMADILRFLENELQRLKVPVWLNTPFDEVLFEAVKPDVVVLASGSLPDMPIIKGLFTTRMHLCTVTDVLDGKTATGGRVIVIGGGQAGLLLADYLAEGGKTVAVLNRKAHFAEEMSSNDRYYLRQRLKKEDVTLYKKVMVEKFDDFGVTFKSAGQPFHLDGFDTVVIAEAMAPLRDVKTIISKTKTELHLIGDANQPRNLMLSLSEAEELGRSL